MLYSNLKFANLDAWDGSTKRRNVFLVREDLIANRV